MTTNPTLSYESPIPIPAQRPRFRWLPATLISVVVLSIEYWLIHMFGDGWSLHLDFFSAAMVLAAFAPVFVKGRGLLRFSFALSFGILLWVPWYWMGWSIDYQTKRLSLAIAVTICVLACWQAPRRQAIAGFVCRLALICLAVAAVVRFADDFFLDATFLDDRKFELRSGIYFPLGAALAPLVFLPVLWTGARWTHVAYGRTPSRRRDAFFIAVLSTTILICSFYFVFKPQVALFSLRHGYPITTSAAMRIISERHTPDGLVWATLEQVNWDDPHLHYDRDTEQLIKDLSDRDPPSAERLARLLIKYPNGPLPGYAAPLLAKARRFEAIPTLLRLSLFDFHTTPCADALADMSAPQAPWALLHAYSVAATGRGYPVDFVIPEVRAKLSRIVGADAGENAPDWHPLLQQKAHGRHPLIPDGICDEADRIVAAYLSDRDSHDQLTRFIADRVAEAAPSAHLHPRAREIIRDFYPRLPSGDYFDVEVSDLIEEICSRHAPAELPATFHDTAHLEREVAAYRDRVQKLVVSWKPIQQPSAPPQTPIH